MTMLAMLRSTLLVAFIAISMFGLAVLLRLLLRRTRTSVRSTVAFVYLLIFACAFWWFLARLRGRPFLDSWPTHVLLIGLLLIPVATGIPSREPSLKTKLLTYRITGALWFAGGIVLLLLEGHAVIVIALAFIGAAVLLSFVFPRRLIREAREKERLEAEREGEGQRDSEHPKEQEGAEPQ